MCLSNKCNLRHYIEDYSGVMGVSGGGDGEDGDVVVYMRGEAKVANVFGGGGRSVVQRAMQGALRGQVTRWGCTG
jgi:hypothetical protein